MALGRRFASEGSPRDGDVPETALTDVIRKLSVDVLENATLPGKFTKG